MEVDTDGSQKSALTSKSELFEVMIPKIAGTATSCWTFLSAKAVDASRKSNERRMGMYKPSVNSPPK